MGLTAEVDEEFQDPRLAALYDVFDPDRSDLEPYLAHASRPDVRRVIDIGCGTGVFALLLAARGLEVVGVDPAPASLAVARAKPAAAGVRWIDGDACALAEHAVIGFDLATMTANVAMVLCSDDAAAATLTAIASALRPGGHVVFETRRPDARAWEGWTREATYTQASTDAGRVESWIEVTEVRWPLLEFRSIFVLGDGTRVASDSILRYRDIDEWLALLDGAGFDAVDVADAPDRPGREWIVRAARR